MEKPMIGVIPLWDDKRKSLWMLPGYLNGIREAGGLPVMLPLEVGSQDVFRLCSLCDGLLFTGGQDVDPALYHAVTSPLCGAPCPARDHLETLLFRQAFDEDKPMLGICRGVQLMNALLGGTLYQHLPDELSGFVNHQMSPPYDLPCHTVQLENGGMLRRLLGTGTIGVNSYHHQGIREPAPSLRVEARAPDGLVEAVTCPTRRFLLGVQWHPEFSYRTESSSAAIFRAFVESCTRFRNA